MLSMLGAQSPPVKTLPRTLYLTCMSRYPIFASHCVQEATFSPSPSPYTPHYPTGLFSLCTAVSTLATVVGQQQGFRSAMIFLPSQVRIRKKLHGSQS